MFKDFVLYELRRSTRLRSLWALAFSSFVVFIFATMRGPESIVSLMVVPASTIGLAAGLSLSRRSRDLQNSDTEYLLTRGAGRAKPLVARALTVIVAATLLVAPGAVWLLSKGHIPTLSMNDDLRVGASVEGSIKENWEEQASKRADEREQRVREYYKNWLESDEMDEPKGSAIEANQVEISQRRSFSTVRPHLWWWNLIFVWFWAALGGLVQIGREMQYGAGAKRIMLLATPALFAVGAIATLYSAPLGASSTARIALLTCCIVVSLVATRHRWMHGDVRA